MAFKITANIEIIPFTKGGRKTNILSGYRPTFYFMETMSTSGAIVFDSIPFISPIEGKIVEVDIYFIDNQYLGSDLGIGSEFIFKEGGRIIGKGNVSAIVGFVSQVGDSPILK